MRHLLLKLTLIFSFFFPKKVLTDGMKYIFKKKFDKQQRVRELTGLQRKVTQEEGTESAFQNPYWDHKEEGIYVDIVSGEPLFSSLDKFDSGTGWPSFSKPLVPSLIVEKTDLKLFLPRTEVRSKHADGHLGHVFQDGPAPTGLRYCINSAALQFIPKNKLEKAGLAEFLPLFNKKASPGSPSSVKK